MCLMLDRGLAAGDFVTFEAAKETPCRKERPILPLRYDRSAGAPLVMEALPAGTYLGPLSLKPGTIAAAGEKLRLVIRSGPVTIVREVQPVKAARSGEKTFVKTEDGEVLVARFIDKERAE